eukprot:gene8756-14782_t
MPADFNDVREYVGIKPMPTSSHVGLRITARCSTPVYTCESPARPEVVKQNYDRRRHQISSCGYRSVNFKPYKEVGEVILNEKELILKSLGQGITENTEGQEDEDKEQSNQLKIDNNDAQKEKDIITITHPKPENLQKLEDQLTKGRHLMNKVKLGIGLFKLIKEEQNRKAIEEEYSRIKSEVEAKKSMRPYDPDWDFEDEIEDSNDVSSLVHDNILTETRTTELTRIELHTEEHEEKNEIPLKNGGIESTDLVLAMNTSDGEKNSGCLNERPKSRSLHLQEKNDADVLSVGNCSSRIAKNKLNRSKKYKITMPRPFSPIFTNVNFYETGSKEYTFRQLCALYWILEAMSQDQNIVMPPISTCWKLKDLKQDLHTAQWKVDRDKAVDPIWTAFLRNPNRFTRSKPGGRGGLLQRRISIAPNALRRISAASNATQASGFKFSSLSEDSASTSASHMPASKEESRGRSLSKLGFLFKRDEVSADERRFNPRKPTLAQVAEEAKTQQAQVSGPSLKEKAFIVREVVIAKNVFGRRGSKLNKARSSSVTLAAAKSATDKLKKNKKTIKETSRKESLGFPGDIPETGKSLDHFGTETTGVSEVSIIDENQNVPLKFKERFEELAAEKALILHDNLEQREKTSVQSMERKFCSLRIMSDVNKAISVMRSKSRLKVETDEEKKARFSEECSWYKSLLENLSPCIREDMNNALVLDKIAKYGSMEGRKVSSVQFIKALSILRPWELCHPDISAAIEFVRDKIVAMDKTEFETWFESRLSESK